MSHADNDASHAGSDGLWRWLVGGLLAGGAILGLLVAAYEVGYDRGQDSRPSAAPAPATSPATTARTATTSSGIGPVTATPALVARGEQLYTSDGCAGCHSLTGAAGAGPALDGIAGGTSKLAGGQTVAADDAYLARSITDPDAEIVDGYQPGIMSAATAGRDFASRPDDVRALVAFLKSQK